VVLAKQMDTRVFCNLDTAEVSIRQSTDYLDLDLVAAGRRGVGGGREYSWVSEVGCVGS
jgi:hypothetical protein